jgi:uncharacterized membrane protein
MTNNKHFKISSRRNRDQRGFTIVAYATMLIVIMGFTGMAVDVGYLQWQKRMAQAAADSAVMGALREIELGNTDLVAAGRNDAGLNGFVHGQNGVTVTINNTNALWFYCAQGKHCQAGMVMAVNVNATVTFFREPI